MKLKIIALTGLIFACGAFTHASTTTDDIKALVASYALEYGVSGESMLNTLKCESGLNPNAYNGKDSHKLSKGSHGIAQFSKETFDEFSNKIGIVDGSPYNPDQAIETMAYMFSIGKQHRWTCYKPITKM